MHTFPNGAGFHPEVICEETPMQLWMAPREGAGRVMIRWPPTIELLRAMCTSTTQTTASTGPSFSVDSIPHRNQTDNRQTNQSTQLFPISPHCPLWVEWLILTHLPFSFLHCYHSLGLLILQLFAWSHFPSFGLMFNPASVETFCLSSWPWFGLSSEPWSCYCAG